LVQHGPPPKQHQTHQQAELQPLLNFHGIAPAQHGLSLPMVLHWRADCRGGGGGATGHCHSSSLVKISNHNTNNNDSPFAAIPLDRVPLLGYY
jgi:hypothetical protein